MAATEITVQEFLSRFQGQPESACCFLLGAGASRSSGIPTGHELVARWPAETHANECADATPVAAWATAQTLGIEGFDFARTARFYPQVFKRRFAGQPEEGYAFLATLLRGNEPSLGYLILAQILTEERLPHRAVITPNFDHLAADALAIATHAMPLVCDHEAFTGFLRPQPHGPLIARTYRDLRREPLNAPPAVTDLGPGWDHALRTLLGRAVPVVIGYGGSDGGLLEFLRDLPAPVPDGLCWCYLAAGGAPEADVRALVEQHHGFLVPSAGFDELMFQIGETLGLDPRPDVVAQRAREREAACREQIDALRARTVPPTVPPPVGAPAPVGTAEPWRVWDQRAEVEPGPERREAILRQGLAALPESADLTERQAEFLFRVRRDPVPAGPCYLRALGLDPQDAGTRRKHQVFLRRRAGLPVG